MKTYVIDLACGCCQDTLQFSDDEAISKAFAEVGLTSSATITDETGKTVEDIDTFYGFREEQKAKEDKRGKLEGLF